MEAAPGAHKQGLHSAAQPSNSRRLLTSQSPGARRHSAGLTPAHQIAPIPGHISAAGHGERHPSAIIRYTCSAAAISIDMRKVAHHEVQTLMTAATAGDWNNPIFLAPHAYSILLQAYLNEMLDPEQFMNIQQCLEVYSQFGVRQDLPPAARLSAKVMRIDINAPENYLEREKLIEEMHTRKTPKGLAELFCKTLTGLQKSNTPAWVDLIAFANAEERRRFLGSNCFLRPPRAESREENLQGQVYNWMRALECSFTPVIRCLYINEMLYLFIPTHSINRRMQQTATSDPVDLYPFYGTETADQLWEQRAQGIHPRACFHPLAVDNLSSPHGLYFGSLEGIHDEYHCHQLNRIPGSMRALLLDIDRKEQDLRKRIEGMILKSGETILDHLPKDFVSATKQSLCPLSSKPPLSSKSPLRTESPDCDSSLYYIPISLACFPANRPFLDQECCTFPTYAEDANDKGLACHIAAWTLKLNPVFMSAPSKYISKYLVIHTCLLKWHWLLYQYRCHSPEKLLRLRDIFVNANRAIKGPEGASYHWSTYSQSDSISYPGLMSLMGDLANEYARGIE